MWESIIKVIELQSEFEQEFNLFITSRSYPRHIHSEAAEELVATMDDNLANVEGLREVTQGLLGIQSFQELYASDFTEFFTRSLPKQILEPSHDNGCILTIHSLFNYERIH